jgi:hypothetical protein
MGTSHNSVPAEYILKNKYKINRIRASGMVNYHMLEEDAHHLDIFGVEFAKFR